MIKVLKVITKPNGSCDIELEYDKTKLYPILKSTFNVKRVTKKLVTKFVKEALLYYVEKKR